MSGFRPANKKFDQLRKGPGTPRGASKNGLRPPPVRSFFTMLAISRLRALARVAEHPGRLPKRLERLWKGPPKPLETPFWAFLHTEAMRRYMFVLSIYIYIHIHVHIHVLASIQPSDYPRIHLLAYRLTALLSYRLAVLSSQRLAVLPLCRLTPLPFHNITILTFFVLPSYSFTVFAVLPPYHLAVLPP